MNSNILFIVIDGMRTDKIYGTNKTSLTPNLDLLLAKGTFFSHAISSSDGTRTCVGSMLTAQYPFQSGLDTFHNYKSARKFFELFKKNGYTLAGTLPDTEFWITFSEPFDTKDMIPKPYEYLFGGTGEKIISQLEKLKGLQPWIYYIHVMDLHKSVNYALPEKFKDKKFGESTYEKMISGIDFWIGKILEKIDLTKTLIVITSDHGEFIPISSIDQPISYMPSLVKFGQKIKKVTPKKLPPTGESTFVKIRTSLVPLRKSLLKKKLSVKDMRTLNERGTKFGWELFDEVVCTPLLFSGYNVKSGNVINNQVRQIDIFPSILSIIDFESIPEDIEGESLLSLINGEKMIEKPALIENQLLDPDDTDIVIGIRTSAYKYFRNINNKNIKLRLFDLKNDPQEQKNVASEKPEIVSEMEDLLMKYRKHDTSPLITENQDEYDEKIKEELKKMGYI
jgi:arylsulfatase A-like enzyme